jgi:hypothetical protein
MSPFLKDLAERVVWTFVQAFGGAFTVAAFSDIDAWQAALVAGAAAVLSLLKGVAASRLTRGTAQLGVSTYMHELEGGHD